MSDIDFKNTQLRQKDELAHVYDRLCEVEKTRDYIAFYSFIRMTKLPFIPCYEKDIKIVYKECFDVLHRIGEISIPVAVALSMHYYILASLATFPFSKMSKQYWKREALLKKIKNERLLIANTGSVRTFQNVSGNKSVVAQKEGNSFLINGETSFMSLSEIADYIVFTAKITEGKKAIFFIAGNTNGIEFYDTVFSDTMQGSFTKSVKFRNVRISQDCVIEMDKSIDTRNEILVYQRSWFQALVAAPYLGAAYRVILDLKIFSKKKIRNDKKLSESESFLESIGELMAKYKTARNLCEFTGISLASFKKGNVSSLEKIFETSVLSKFYATHVSEEIVNKVRYIMGSKFLSPDSITNKIYKEIVYGVLQPMTDLDIKNYFSESLMSQEI